MTDNVAILAGYTVQVECYAAATYLCLMVQPGTDLDSRFKAWDMDAQEFIQVNGWACDFVTDE